MKQQQPNKNAQPSDKDMKMDKQQKYPDTTDQRLDEMKETRDDLYGKSSENANKGMKK